MKRLLITGGTGFIGSHTCLTLLQNNYELIVIDSFANSNQKVLEKVKLIMNEINNLEIKNLSFIKCDLRDLNLLNSIFADYYRNGKTIDGVFHFSGLKSVPESFRYPLNYWENNVCGTINLLKVMDKYCCNLIVFSSTATVYGKCKKEVIHENEFCDPISPYGMTKYVIEKILNDLYLSNSSFWKIANLRYFNPIGAHPSGLIGESPSSSSSNIFPKINNVALGKEKEIKIFGNDWPTKDGTCLRDYIHVMDLAEGHLRALKYLEKSSSGILNLNLGTGQGTTVIELINVFQQVNKIKIPYIFTSRREGDNGVLVADNSLSKSLLNWEPKKDIADMCKDGWRWFKNNP